MKLYNHELAPNPRRVRIFAAEKEIKLALEEVDILVGQSRTSEFLAKNSSGAVPVLELDDGSYLSESVAICRYLEGLQPDPNLLGRDLCEQAEIERWNRACCTLPWSRQRRARLMAARSSHGSIRSRR
jgi:glutathione S-transferase